MLKSPISKKVESVQDNREEQDGKERIVVQDFVATIEKIERNVKEQ